MVENELGDLLKPSWNDVGGIFTSTPTSSHPAWGKAGGAVGCSAPDTQESKDPASGSEHTSLPRRVVLFPYRDALGRGPRHPCKYQARGCRRAALRHASPRERAARRRQPSERHGDPIY